MNRLQGKVRSISVKEVTEGIQVIIWGRIVSINSNKQNQEGYITLKEAQITKDKLKTLAVEYESVAWEEHIKELIFESAESKRRVFEGWQRDCIKQLSLKHSQWQSAVDNSEVDSDKVVEFEIITKVLRPGLGAIFEGENGLEYLNTKYAKIIPHKKRMYSEEDVWSLFVKMITADTTDGTLGKYKEWWDNYQKK